MSESSSNLSREYSQKHIRGGEKKVMKKTLSSVVSIALISSMFATAVFAETASTPETTNTSASATKELTTQEKYDALKAAGVFEGDSTGANLEGLTDRAQIAKIIAKAFELSENASGASVYKDEAFETPEFSWSLGFVGAVTKAGLMDGVWEGVFDPASNVTHEQIATILVKAFKLEHPATAEVEGEVSDWAKGYVAAAVKAGLIKAQTDYTVAAKRSDLVESAWTAIKKFESEKPVTALKVSGVTALTNNKVSITLSEAVTAVDKSKISIKHFDGSALEVKDASLSADGKTVTVTTAAQTAYAAYAVTADGVTKNFVGLPTDSDKPKVSTLTPSHNTVVVEFNEKVDAATAGNKDNYSIDNSLTVESATVDGKKVTLKTSAQTNGKLYTLTVQNVADLAGNVMDKSGSLYFGGIVDSDKPKVDAVTPSHKTLKVTFNEAVSKDSATNLANYVLDNDLKLSDPVYDADSKKSVTFTTTDQVNGKLYKLTAKGVADLAGNTSDSQDIFFGGIVDTTPPTVSVAAGTEQNNTVIVTFGDDSAIDKASAENINNYTLDNNVTVTKATLDGKVVTLTTSDQVDGKLYKLTVKGVADIAGNVISTVDQFFGGVVNTAGPAISGIQSGGKKVVLTFNRKLNKELAQDPTNYSFDGGLGYPTTATLADDKKTVTLETAEQTLGKLYTVTVNNLKDLSGISIAANTKKGFSGVNTSVTGNAKLQSILSINESTIDLIFDREVTAANADAVTVAVYEGSSISSGSTVKFNSIKGQLQPEKKIVRVYFNPTNVKFESGKVYSGLVSGFNVVTDNNANVQTFAGNPTKNEAPFVTAAPPVTSTSVKVLFSKGVKNVKPTDFKIEGQTVVSIQDQPAADKIVNEVVLNLQPTNGKALEGGKVYNMTFVGNTITDATGLQTLKAGDYTVKVSGVDLKNAAPKMQAAVAKDKYNIEIIFTEAVNNAANTGLYTITTEDGTSTVTGITYANVSQDGKGVILSLDKNVAGAELKSGKMYKVTYTGGSAITDKEGLAYDTASEAKEARLPGVETANEKPYVVAVDAVANTGIIKLTFSEKLFGALPAAANFKVKVGDVDVTVTGATLNADKNVVELTTSTVFESAKTGTVSVENTATFTDINGQTAKTDAVSFGTR